MSIKVSILIPVLNESKFIQQLLNCITKQVYPMYLLEVLIIDGGSKDETIEIVKRNMYKYNFNIYLYDNPNKIQASALNIGLKNSKGDIIIRLDAHSYYEDHYIEKIIKHLENPDIINIGGPAIAKGYDFFSTIIANAVTSPIGVGGAQFRYTKNIIESDTVFPGSWKKSQLEAIGGWNEEMVINEDTELNFRLKQTFHGKIIVDPEVHLYYYPRNNILKLAKQYFNFGYWRMKTANIYSRALRYSHLGAIIGTPILLASFFSILIQPFIKQHTLLKYFPGIFVLYLIAIFFCNVLINFRQHKFSCINVSLETVCIITMHLSWGIGAIIGLCKFGFPYEAIKNKVCFKG